MIPSMNVCEAIIRKLASTWIYRMPKSSGLEYEDLVQEGWIAFLICKDLYKPEKGGKFTSFLYYAVRSRLKNIFTNETRAKRLPVYGFSQLSEDTVGSKPRQERDAMISEALSAMSEVSADFVRMVVDEVPIELSMIARRRARIMNLKRGRKAVSAKIKFTDAMIEDFFGLKISELKSLYYNYV